MLKWDEAEEYLYEMAEAYGGLGRDGIIGLLSINPLIKRFELGERSISLYEEIMSIE